MIESVFNALLGRCPACHEGRFKSGFYTIVPTCPVCHARYERWEGSWTISVVMGYGSGALFATLLGIFLYFHGGLDGAENIIIPGAVLFTAAFYPICKNVTVGLLHANGYVYPDPPRLLDPPADTPDAPGPPS